MKVHELKCHPPFFGQIVSGRKRWEIRRNDRDFARGDLLHLREYDPITSGGQYSGADCFVQITDIWDELPDGALCDRFVVMAIEKVAFGAMR